MKVRAKFTVGKVAEIGYAGANGPHRSMCYRDSKETDVPVREITMNAVYDDGMAKENASFAEATPSGTIMFTLNNPDLVGEFKPGQIYYVDFTPAEAVNDPK
jgi:hypothetical protein